MNSKQVYWIDDSDSSRCSFPRYISTFGYIACAFGSSAALLLLTLPFVVLLLAQLFMPAGFAQQAIWIRLLPVLITGLPCFPLGLFILYKSLILLARTDLELDHKRLAARRRLGPLSSSKTVRLSRVQGFRLEASVGERPTEKLASIAAVTRKGEAIYLLRAFPAEVLQPVAASIPAKIEAITFRTSQLQASDFPIENAASDPFGTGARNAKPMGSNIACEETEQRLELEIAPLGFFHSTPGFLFRLWFLGFMATQAFVLCVIVPALLAGQMQGNLAMGWLIVGVFTAFSVAILLYRWNKSIHSGTVSVSGGNLRFFERDLFGRSESLWHLDKISEVQVSIETEKNAEGTLNWRHYLQVQLVPSEPPLGKSPRTWFCNRSKEELEWIATKINERLPMLESRP